MRLGKIKAFYLIKDLNYRQRLPNISARVRRTPQRHDSYINRRRFSIHEVGLATFEAVPLRNRLVGVYCQRFALTLTCLSIDIC
jgi:hypothetical protein